MAANKTSGFGGEIASASHLIIIVTITIFSVVLVLLNRLLEWEPWMVPVVVVGLCICQGIHISGKGSPRARIFGFSLFLMFEVFYYTVNINTLYDSTALIVIVMFIFAATGEKKLVALGAAGGISGMIMHLIALSNSTGLKLGLSDIIRSGWQFALVLLTTLLAGKMSSAWSNTEASYQHKIRELQNANAHANNFLANVSHEIRTPVNAVIGLAGIMEKEQLPKQTMDNISAIRNAGHRVAEQISDIMDFTEIDMKRLAVSSERYMISSIVNDLLTQMQFTEDYGLDLVIDLAVNVPQELIGDASKIKKILWHLIINGFKFTKSGGVYVKITCKKREYGVNLVLEVADTGIGMNETEIEHVYDKFYQSDSGRSRTAGGLGLGIPIVNGFARSMDGFMHIESTPGQGTLVRVSIPQKVADLSPCISIDNKDKICAAGFLGFQTTEDPRIKQFYMEMIDHFVTGLGVSFHRVISVDELKRLAASGNMTHIFVGTGEYLDNRAYIEQLADTTYVILVEDKDFSGTPGKHIALLRKPFSGMQIANFLSCSHGEPEENEKSRMTCPDVRVLVVDDDPMNLLVARGIFESYDMQVTIANSGQESIDICRTKDFDVIFMDHMMPGMDGVEAMKKLRSDADKKQKSLCIAALTANASSAAKEMFLSEGFDAFLPKPIELMELERVLKHILPRNLIRFQTEEIIKTPETAAQETKPDDPYHALREFGVNIESGYQYCMNDDAFYRNILAEYAKDRSEKIKQLTGFYEAENWKEYAIRVHSIKSTSKMIGADALSETARTLEFAAKETNTEIIRRHHQTFLTEYARLLELITSLLGMEGSSDEPEALEFAPSGRTNDDEILEFAPGGDNT